MVEITAGPPIADGEGDALVVPVFADLTWGPGAEWLVERLEWLEPYAVGQDFSGKIDEVLTAPGGGTVPYARLVLVGLGDEADAEQLRRAAANAARATTKQATVVTTLHQVDLEEAEDLVAFGFTLGQYQFDGYRTDPPRIATERLVLAAGSGSGARGAVLAGAVARARDLVNEPAGGKSPTQLAEWAHEHLEPLGVEVTVWDAERIAAERLGGLAAVAAGSHEPACLVKLRYRPEPAQAKVAFVGKGIVFDSGGLSLKPPASMEDMKSDMSGAAAVFGALWAIASLQVPVEVLGITPLTENMPGGRALRPGDVFRARNGKTVEVLNTDAEGRLVLADGLSLAVEDEPGLIVDIATLTGACKVALGEKVGGFFASNEDVAGLIEAAARRAGEPVWPLPLDAEYRSKLDSDVADLKNIGDRFGGAITAALFLQEFAGGLPWAHLDIAGPARAGKAEHYIAKGGTGFGARTLVALAEMLAEG